MIHPIHTNQSLDLTCIFFAFFASIAVRHKRPELTSRNRFHPNFRDVLHVRGEK
jgi:hypothetical protein